MKDLLRKVFKLDSFVTPKIIRVLYFMIILFVLVYGVFISFTAFESVGFFFGVTILFLTLLFGPLFVRVSFELIKLPFAILEELRELNGKGTK